jgi:hypothetical protein
MSITPKVLKSLQKMALEQSGSAAHLHSLVEHPFDSWLLQKSSLYAWSRKQALKNKIQFTPALLSSERSLGSISLLAPVIQYSPLRSEIEFRLSGKDAARRVTEVRSWVTSIYHEQNHRNLWKIFPLCPKGRLAIRRYLNLVESLVVVADMALADALPADAARALYSIQCIYDPGSEARRELDDPLSYRIYLRAAIEATYLTLERYDPKKSLEHMQRIYGEIGARATKRAQRIDPAFVFKTNPLWQSKHMASIQKNRKSIGVGPEVLELPEDGRDMRLLGEIAEAWIDQLTSVD